MPTRRIILLGATLAIVASIAYGGASVVVWDRLTRVSAEDCQAKWGANTPEDFGFAGPDPIDTGPWAMPAPEDVRLPSRDRGIEIAAWWLPATDSTAPAVIVVHGFTACRRDHDVLLPAGMLHRHGFSVLLIDLRDHGDSTREDGRFAGGTDEYQDVLGAWDWLRAAQGIPSASIGLLGLSLGAATVLLAAGREPGVAAVWEDSSYADLASAIEAELMREGYPTFLTAGGLLAARLISGDDLVSYSPLDAVHLLAGRPLAITHGTADERLSVGYGRRLEHAVRSDGGDVEAWYPNGAGHTKALMTMADEYERRVVAFFVRTLATSGP